MSEHDELRELIDDTARDLGGLVSDPRDWSTWIIYLLEGLEAEAFRRGLDPDHPEAVETMFERVKDAIDDRLSKHGWVNIG